MRIECYDIRGQVFTHVDPKTKVNTVFAVTDLRRHCDHTIMRPRLIALEKEDARMILQYHGLEDHRLQRAMRTKVWLPLLFTHMPDGTWLLVDGSHTYVARVALGHRAALAYLVPQEIWTYFTAEGLPDSTEEELANSWSGIH